LKALVHKTGVIRQQLGSLAPVLERRLEERLTSGIVRRDVQALTRAIEDEELDPDRARAVTEELEATRKRDDQLKAQISDLQDLLAKSREWLRLEDGDLRQAISCGLELMGSESLQAGPGTGEFALPDLASQLQTDPSWMHTLDTLRAGRRKGQPVWEWREEQGIRPVVFADQGSLDAKAVHLHLEHRFVQRLLGRFRSQGFVHHDLSRACVGYTDDPIARVILLGRLSLYGDRASRLHDEILAVAARWTDASIRKDALKPYGDDTLDKTIGLLEKALSADRTRELPEQVRQRLASGSSRDLGELQPHLKAQAELLTRQASATIASRGDKEAAEMRAILDAQRERIRRTQARKEKEFGQLPLFAETERKQIEADAKYWDKRYAELGAELETEPARIRRSYDVKASRFEPVGLVYLWPITG
jgi:hypothetical protein